MSKIITIACIASFIGVVFILAIVFMEARGWI
jgi:hypothetical protein